MTDLSHFSITKKWPAQHPDRLQLYSQNTPNGVKVSIMLEETEVSRGLVGKYVDTYAWPDGRFEVRWKGFSLPYRVFDADQQRVTHAAITENKRLSEALAYAKEIQDARLADEAVKIGKQRTKYTPTGRKTPGPKGWIGKRAERRATEAATHAAE